MVATKSVTQRDFKDFSEKHIDLKNSQNCILLPYITNITMHFLRIL